MINDKRIIFIVASLFIVLLVGTFGYSFLTSSVSMKDDTGAEMIYSPADGTTLKLDSGWQAYTDRELENPVDLEPGRFGTGNYYWQLSLNTAQMKGFNALLINPIYSAYNLWINGEKISICGKPSEDCEELSFIRARVVPFEQDTDELDILIQVSNSVHFYGGSMMTWLTYGRYADVEFGAHQGKAFESLIIFILFSFAMIHLFNYFYQRKYPYSMFFFVYMLIYSFYALFTGRVVVSYLLPMFTANLIFRMEGFFLVLAFPVMLNYMKSLFPDEVHRPVIKFVEIVSIAALVLVFVLPLNLMRYMVFIYTGLRVVCAVYLIICMIFAVRNGRYASKLTLISFSIMALCMLNDILFSIGLIASVRLVFAGLIVFAAQQTYRLIMDGLADNRFAEETYNKFTALSNQKESFFSRNSIELYRPIRNIVELGEGLLRGSIGPLNSEQIANSSLIVSNGIRLSNMVNDILDFSSIRDNSLNLNITAVDLFQITHKVLNSCEALVAVHDKTLSNEVTRDTPRVAADEQRIEQILYNIVSNSVRHIDSGDVQIRTDISEEEVRIIVRVTGSDLDLETVVELFSAYEQSQSSSLDNKDVSDLSLAIAKKLIELHDEDLGIDTEENVLIYSFSLPLWTGEAPLTDEEVLEIDALINLQPVFDEVTSDRDIEILVAGKDVEALQILKTQLASMNYTVIPMISGKDLLGRVEEDPPHLVIIDVKLPDMSGYEVCLKIREKFSKDELPVIIVINKEDVSDMMEGLTSGANDFLTRPYIQEEFLTRVNTHLQLSRISTVYSRFVPTEFLKALGQENIVDVALGDQVQREMTILFVDIRAFTSLSENMTPEENFKFINSYLSRFSPMITNNGGFVDKYIGDAIMALFPYKPEDALAAAAEMIEHVNVYNGHRANCGYKAIGIGIGIHTGSMILGIIGDEKRMQGTVISDAVNLASRIQDVTKLYKANVVISQETFVKLENPMDYNFRFLGRVKVKGKNKAVALFEIFDSDSSEKLENKNRTKTNFEEAIMKFSRREFEKAAELLDKVAASDPDDETAKVFLERIGKMQRAEKKNFLTSL
ncbi:MAG: response regulator [Spirochaetales bacterium]|nr:response regulator [Spirochaetales bacterium]